ncbi:hypothetical protein MP228_000971 [Amoeboaphelidium protococcarum]|nr:hypothetical protein MP228_000971 [Amoeboaphelidium protococcarum]
MSVPQLTEGMVAAMYQDLCKQDAKYQSAFLQVLNVKNIGNQSNADRFRIVLSDGQHCCAVVLPVNLNALASQLEVNNIVVLRQFVCQEINNKKIFIAMDLEKVGNHSQKIGAPVLYDENALRLQQQRQQTTGQAQSMARPSNGNTGGVSSSSNQQQQQGQQYQQQQPQTASNQDAMFGHIQPIKSLNPYINKWTIKVRVSSKSDVRVWNNQRGEGKLFSVTFVDESGEIKATGFNDAVDKLYNVLEQGKVYYVSKAQVKPARKIGSFVQNDYEITFENSTEVSPCLDAEDASKIPFVRYNFVEIAELNDAVKDSIVDIIAVVKEVGEVQQIVAKSNNRQLTKRDITLVDKSNTTVKMTLWGTTAEQFDAQNYPVVAFKGVKVSDFGGRTLSASPSSVIQQNPDIPEAYTLKGWFDSVGQSAHATSISTTGEVGQSKSGVRKQLAQIADEGLGQNDKPDYITVKATIGKINGEKTLWYTACPSEGCNKKVISEGASWRCEKCRRTFDRCEYRYIFNCPVLDASGTAWFQFFNDIGKSVIGMGADELNRMKENGNIEAFDSILAKSAWQTYLFNVRVKQENYNEEMRVRCSVMSVDQIDYIKEAKMLSGIINEY